MIWNDFWVDWYLKDTSKKNRLAIFSELFLDRYGKKNTWFFISSRVDQSQFDEIFVVYQSIKIKLPVVVLT